MSQKQSLSDRFWNDKNGKFVVWQRPNILLAFWIAALILSIVLPDSGLERLISLLSGVAIFAWALLELFLGVNYFRRLLGLCVVLLIVATHVL